MHLAYTLTIYSADQDAEIAVISINVAATANVSRMDLNIILAEPNVDLRTMTAAEAEQDPPDAQEPT